MDIPVIPQSGGFSSARDILAAIITPAVLISACAVLTISTSNRVGRLMERTRRLSDMFQNLVESQGKDVQSEGEYEGALRRQIARATRRSQLLQRVLAGLYLSIAFFVASSVAIGADSISGYAFSWLPIFFSFAGVSLLFYSSVLLIVESRIGLAAVAEEMEFISRLAGTHVHRDVSKKRK